jgi:hypothetical protein
MSQSSEIGGWVDMDPESDWRDGTPLSPTALRNMANNANHAADEDVQVLVNQPPPFFSAGIGGTGVGAWNKSGVTDSAYKRIVRLPLLAVRRHPGGSIYPIRIYMTARSTPAETVEWVVAVTPQSNFSEVFSDPETVRAGFTGVATGTTTLSTYAVVSFTFGSGIGMPWVDSARRQVIGSPIRHGSSRLTAVFQPTVEITIWAKRGTVGSSVSAFIGSFHAHQFYRTV